MRDSVKYTLLFCITLFYVSCEKNKIAWTLEKVVRLPNVNTFQPSTITSNSALVTGRVESDGGGKVTNRGVCYSKKPTPVLTDNKIESGNDTGNFTVVIQGLASNTKYYLRAYATNSKGTAYGGEFSLNTLPPSSLNTKIVSNITYNSATCGGQVNNDGGYNVTARGVCWNSVGSPTINNNKTINGTGTGSFSSNLTSLSPNTNYFVRAYATNSFATYYGNEVSFTTIILPTIPKVTTTSITTITPFSAQGGGNVTDIGGAPVTSRGICWSLYQNPTLSNSFTKDGSGLGTFSSNLTNLAPNTIYYVRSYASNSFGTAYGNQVNFTTSSIYLPIITTTTISNITQTSASSGGFINSDGGSIITSKGVCWSTSINPTVANSKTMDGTGAGNFISGMTGLSAGTIYYVRAYATNSVGTAYGGNQEIFTTTAASLPTLTTSNIVSITQTSGVSGGNIYSDGGSAITSRGVCWGTSANPTIANSKTINGSGSGAFTSNITGLNASTLYYLRAYATNSVGTAYGPEISFASIVIGSSYQGGIVAYILTSGDPGYSAITQHGLIVSTLTQSTGIKWYNGSFVITGATGSAIGTGNSNTNLIVSSQGAGSYAAKLCSDLVLGGYSDWYLPSLDELNKLYLNKSTIGGFTSNVYWSSKEINNVGAWGQNFSNGVQNAYDKQGIYYVRAIRSF